MKAFLAENPQLMVEINDRVRDCLAPKADDGDSLADPADPAEDVVDPDDLPITLDS